MTAGAAYGPPQLVTLHGIAARGDLPLPFSFLVAGSAAALVLSFVVLAVAWPQPRFARLGGRPVPNLQRLVDHPVSRWTVALVMLAGYAWAGLAMVAGPDRLTNPIFGFVYVWVWVGLVPVSVLFGRVWRAANPLRTLHRGLCALARVDPSQGLARMPARWGVWPAAVGLVGFTWLELVQPDRTTLAVLRLWVLGWLVAMIVGAIIGGSRWIGAADPFETYADTVARLSPWRRAAGELRVVHPLAGLSTWTPPPGSTAVVAVLLGSTAFDSFTNTTWWIVTVQGSALPATWWESAGLLGMIGLVGLAFGLAALWMARYGRPGRHRRTDYPRLMTPSMVPIVVGYAVAHYATLLVVEGQRTAITFSDPLGLGWNVFGTAELGVNTTLFQYPTVIAVIQLAAILAGHLLGIVVAHERAVHLLRAEGAVRGQWPMLLVMVGFTCAGLLLLFSP